MLWTLFLCDNVPAPVCSEAAFTCTWCTNAWQWVAAWYHSKLIGKKATEAWNSHANPAFYIPILSSLAGFLCYCVEFLCVFHGYWKQMVVDVSGSMSKWGVDMCRHLNKCWINWTFGHTGWGQKNRVQILLLHRRDASHCVRIMSEPDTFTACYTFCFTVLRKWHLSRPINCVNTA